MGTNFYRIPKSKEMLERHQRLCDRVSRLDWFDVSLIGRNFATIKDKNSEFEWDKQNPWDEFLNEVNIHLGKRSGGWKFCWNFHNNKYYSNKEELLKYIRSGRVVDEYGVLQDTEEFIEMALSWDGLVADEDYFKKNEKSIWFDWRRHVDKIIDGLRVSSSVEFS
jgi:beta-xylosidase